MSQINLTPRLSPRIPPEKKSLLKSSLIDAHISKEPRERPASAVRRLVREKVIKNSVDLNILSLEAINSGALTSRTPESQSKVFRIRSCSRDKQVERIQNNVQKHKTNDKNQSLKPNNGVKVDKLKLSGSAELLQKNKQTNSLKIHIK